MTTLTLSATQLSSLLSQCESLHSGILSLRQLAPVHQSLCQCSSGAGRGGASTDQVDCQSIPQSPDSLTPIIQLRSTNEQDLALCERILEDGDSKDTERLLMVQFLMFSLSFCDAMRCVLIPYLLSTESSTGTGTGLSEDLVIAMLDLIEGEVEETKEWSVILTSLQAVQTPMAARILVRLLRTSPESSPSLIQAFYDKLWQSLQTVISSRPTPSTDRNGLQNHHHPMIASLSKDLLPILTTTIQSTNNKEDGNGTSPLCLLWTELYRPHTLTLWTRLFSLTETSNDPQRRRLTLLVLTTVLCPLLPHLVDHELPLVLVGSASAASPNDNDLSRRPVEQPAFWQIIYTCLAQGKSLLEDGAALSSILRKRALYLLNTIATTSVWKQYVMCVETLEMESEQHLVDQIWDVVNDLLESVEENDHDHDTPSSSFGRLTWDWMSLLFSAVLSSEQPVIRKLGMYRLLKVKDAKANNNKAAQKRKGKKKTNNIQPRAASDGQTKSMLEHMSPNFFLHVLLPSWDSLGTSVGYTMHLENNRKVEKEEMLPLFTKLLQSYLDRLDAAMAEAFWKELWSWSLIQKLTTKTIVLVFQSLSQKLSTSASMDIPADNETLQSLKSTMQALFLDCSVVLTYRKELVRTVAVMLAHTSQPAGTTKKWTPMTILQLMSLFSAEHFALETEDWSIDGEPTLVDLRVWVSRFDQDAAAIGAAVAAAFVSGQLIPTDGNDWDPTTGATNTEREMAWAIPLLCSLATGESKRMSASQLLWPAINKGLSNTAGAIMTSNNIKAGHVTRALLLLESGCRLRELSGMGNGDLVIDKDVLMPPPPNIEKMLSSSVDFILYHIRTLVSIEAQNESGGGTRSNKAKRMSATYALLITQIRTLQQSYPSSNVISSAVDELLQSSFKGLAEGAENDSKRVMFASQIYAAVSSGADPGPDSHIPLCRLLLKMELSGDLREVSRAWEQAARSVLQYAKWAAISWVLPLFLKTLETASESKCQEAQLFIQDLFTYAFDAVQSTPADALLPLFNCILAAGKWWALTVKLDNEKSEQFYVENLQKIITALLAVMEDSNQSQENMYMLNGICALMFQPKVLAEEYNRLENNPDCETPIRDAFRKLIGMAGTSRPHITRSVLCRITVAWLGGDESEKSSLGLNAIPYRDDIVKLLLHKELKIDESSANQSRGGDHSGVAEIPAHTNELSVTRAFLLVFLSKLPDPSAGLSEKVLKELLHYVILRLLVETAPIKSTHPSMIMKGTPNYCMKMRGWQALCNLSRFVTTEIASQVCEDVFNSMPEPIHNQIRYFMEVFTIKCATMHTEVFGTAFLDHSSHTDLTLQHISSLMILGGNWIVGRYKLDFFNPDSGDNFRLRRVLASIIPWLSSTQGFSRAIAQIMVHAVIPLVIDVNDKNESLADSDWFLRLIYRFLSENREMGRLRNKQTKFFARYNIEEMCTPEGVLGVPVDEGDEADPVHLVDAMKEALKEVYEEAHLSDAPVWKQVEEVLQSQRATENDDDSGDESNDLVNFQRKIIPLDALNLAMEDLREKRLRNAAGQRKQQLIVCASLVDKVPNLGGLARTAEIFAADRLIIPDMAVTKMDNFKGLSVGAGDWIEMEEVRQENLLSWLLDHKAKGYFVFGLEQTSSSISLSDMVFPDRPTILLLGKEKQGIPVEYLQAVDQCVEIPQLGIIRSLNVHVSGAIAIWEHTKQRRLQSSS